MATALVSVLTASGGCIGRAEAAITAPSEMAISEGGLDPVASLEGARAKISRSRAALDALKRVAQPGHLLDPLPEEERTLALEDLRSQYSALQLKVVSLATTLGDHHPDLVAAQQTLADLRNQLLTSIKAAAAAAERDLDEARAVQSATERQLVAHDAEATGSIEARSSALAKVNPPLATHVLLAASEARDASEAVAPTRTPKGQAATLTRIADADWDRVMMAMAAVVLGALAAAAALVALLPTRGRGSKQPRRLIASPIAATVEPDVLPDIPILATIVLPAAAEASRLMSTLEREPDGAVARSATQIAELVQRAAEAAGFDNHVTVLITPLSRSVEVEALTASIAVADAAAGRRVLLMDARPHGRLRDTLLPGAPVAALLELGSVVRPAYELQVAETTLLLLPSDPAENEIVQGAMARPGTARRRGLSGFDTVVVLGQGVEQDAEKLVAGADLVLIAAPQGTSPADLTAASKLLRARNDRPCGVILVDMEEESRIETSPRAAMRAGVSGVNSAPGRTGRDPTRRRVDRGGFRRTFDPDRDRARA